MSDHTPGPWRWLDYPDGRKLLMARSRAVIHAPDGAMSVSEADAALIASAPDVLRERDEARAEVAMLQGIIDAHALTIRELRAALKEGER